MAGIADVAEAIDAKMICRTRRYDETIRCAADYRHATSMRRLILRHFVVISARILEGNDQKMTLRLRLRTFERTIQARASSEDQTWQKAQPRSASSLAIAISFRMSWSLKREKI